MRAETLFFLSFREQGTCMKESCVSLILTSRGQKPITEVERSRPFLIGHVNIRKTLTHSSRDIWPNLERDKFSLCSSFDANFSSFSLAESQWQIFIKKLTRWLNDKTIIELGYRKLLQINYFDLLCSPLTNNDILGDRLFKPQPDQQSGS